MPNPRITFRVPPDLYAQMPEEAEERSHLLMNLLEAHYNPKRPEDELSHLKARVEALERRLQAS